MSKSMAISLPFVLLILDFVPFNRFTEVPFRVNLYYLCREKLAFFIVMIAVIIVTIFTQSAEGSVRSLDQYPIMLRVLNSANSFLIYPIQLIAPYKLSPFYPYPEYITGNYMLGWLPLLISIALVMLCIYLSIKKKIYSPLAVLLSYVVMLAPVVGIIQLSANITYFNVYSYGLICITI